MTRRPQILFVDDDGGTVRPIASSITDQGGAKARVVGPGDLTENDLEWADLLLIDFELAYWPGRDNATELALKPPDGLALAAILRRHTDSKDRKPPTAIAMLTGQYSKLVSPLGRAVGHHVAARLNGLEWAFEKSEDRLRERVERLAIGVQALPKSWGQGDRSAMQLLTLLGVKTKAATEAILDDVRECHPPISSLSSWNHGLIVLRWLLHRVLPYPTCVYSSEYLAARLGVQVESLTQLLADTKSKLGRWLAPARYCGALADFDGPRWWRAEIERLVWKETEGEVSNPEKLREIVKRLGGKGVELLEPSRQYVVCVDDLFRPSSELRPLEECLRVQPDDWPLFAGAAWVSKDTAQQNSEVASLIVGRDRALMKVPE